MLHYLHWVPFSVTILPLLLLRHWPHQLINPCLLVKGESILHPGNSCTIRIEKYKANARQKRKKSTSYPRNNIVYTCHFCLHRNIKRGTPRNTSQPKVKAHPKSTKRKTSNTFSSSDITKDNIVANTRAA